MTAVEVDNANEWLPDTRTCPTWCDKAHAEALAESNGWEQSQLHHSSAGGEVLVGLPHADRHVRGFGGAGT
jgi:hypothetical protein